ncbi:MAG TPA: transcriptional regulator [Cytophagaceae bacterium]
MIDQQKILRVFRLIKILSDKPARTVKEIAPLLEVSLKTVYNYLEVLEALGYLIDKDQRDAYFLFEPSSPDAQDFEPEELQLLNQLISAIDPQHPLRQSLQKKVYLSSTLIPFAEELMDRHLARILTRLNNAIEERLQVKLVKYQSATGSVVRDRIVEPISLVKVNSQLVAYETESRSIKHFKLKRMEDVEVLQRPCTHTINALPTDVFGFTSSDPFIVKLLLSQRAYRLLIEEFPEVRKFISPSKVDLNYPYQFIYEVRSPIGVGRFVLGLPGEIRVLEPASFIDYLRERMKEFCF